MSSGSSEGARERLHRLRASGALSLDEYLTEIELLHEEEQRGGRTPASDHECAEDGNRSPEAAASVAAGSGSEEDEDEELVDEDGQPFQPAAKRPAPAPAAIDESLDTTGLREVASDQVIDTTPQTDNLDAISSFEDERLALPPLLLKGLHEMKFVRPSKIQAASLPRIWAERDLLAQSGNGTGKTACFALGMLKKVDCNLKAPQALCLCPTRELAKQIGDEICKMGKYMITEGGMKIKVILREERWEKGQQIEEQIVVGVPGKTTSLIKMRVLGVDKMQVFVLDEADEMLALLGDVMMRIREQLPKKVQCLFFFATYTDLVIAFAKGLARVSGNDMSQIEVKREHIFNDHVKQLYARCEGVKAKQELLVDLLLLSPPGQCIVFVSGSGAVDTLTELLTQNGHTVSSFHGYMEEDQRDKVLRDVRVGASRILITTNVLARGIDLPDVSLVVQFDMPVRRGGECDPETYLCRTGRTGRFGRPGVALSLVHDERELRLLKQVEAYFACEGLIQEIPRGADPEEWTRLLSVGRAPLQERSHSFSPGAPAAAKNPFSFAPAGGKAPAAAASPFSNGRGGGRGKGKGAQGSGKGSGKGSFSSMASAAGGSPAAVPAVEEDLSTLREEARLQRARDREELEATRAQLAALQRQADEQKAAHARLEEEVKQLRDSLSLLLPRNDEATEVAPRTGDQVTPLSVSGFLGRRRSF